MKFQATKADKSARQEKGNESSEWRRSYLHADGSQYIPAQLKALSEPSGKHELGCSPSSQLKLLQTCGALGRDEVGFRARAPTPRCA